jgi:hypothetical protein
MLIIEEEFKIRKRRIINVVKPIFFVFFIVIIGTETRQINNSKPNNKRTQQFLGK